MALSLEEDGRDQCDRDGNAQGDDHDPHHPDLGRGIDALVSVRLLRRGLVRFVALVERQFERKVKAVQTDWGGEFKNITLSSFFTKIGIQHRFSCPYTHEQNGLVERRNRHVVETGLSLLAHSSVPKRFWHFAFDTTVYLINQTPLLLELSPTP